jgi:hypothetical protein
LPADWDWSDPARLDAAMANLTDALRPWTIDFHVAQNDATVKGSGTHDKTGHHCLPNDPRGRLDIAHHSGYWLRDAIGKPTRALRHICWDGCMFPNQTMLAPKTWSDILAAMIAVRDAHGWTEETKPVSKEEVPAVIKSRKPRKKAVAKKVRTTTKHARVSPKAVFKKKSRKARPARKRSTRNKKPRTKRRR